MGTSFNYDDTSHQVIFDHINGGAGSDALQQSSQAWQTLGDDIGATCKSYAQRAIGTILATRQGAAADAAVAAIGAMVPWMDDVAQIASTAAQRTQGQAEHWVTAKNSVPPVPPTPKSAGFSSDPGEWAAEKMDWFPGVTSDEEKAQLRQQDAAEQARQAMRVYQSNSNGNVDPGPAFTAPQALDSIFFFIDMWYTVFYTAAPAQREWPVGAHRRTCWLPINRRLTSRQFNNPQLIRPPPTSQRPRSPSSPETDPPGRPAASHRHRGGGPLSRHPATA